MDVCGREKDGVTTDEMDRGQDESTQEEYKGSDKRGTEEKRGSDE